MRLPSLLVLLSLAGCEAGAAPADGARAKQLVAEGATLLDVRTPGEFGGSHLPGAKNIPVDELEARVAELDKARPVVTYCAAGVRSARAASLLRTQGFTVHDLGTASAWPSN